MGDVLNFYGYFEGYIQYYLYLLPGIILALIASSKVKSTFNKFSAISNSRGLTGRQAAEAVLRNAGVFDVAIERVSGSMTDHYDPRTNVIRLSETVYDSTSVAAVGVAAHEAGHAVQYATGYVPIKIRSKLVPVANIGSSLSIPLIFIGSMLAMFQLIYLGIALFSFVVLFSLVTLPVEFNASRRAIISIEQNGLLTDSELVGTKKVLSAAAMTYVASFVHYLLLLLYYLGRVNRRSR